MVTFISIRSIGLSLSSFGELTILSATSIPETTLPNAVYWPSRNVNLSPQQKLRPALSGSWARAMDTMPLSWGSSLNSALMVLPGPPIPCVGRSSLLVLGSPPLNHESGNHPVKSGVVIKIFIGQILEVFTWPGARSSKNSNSILPSGVSSTAISFDITKTPVYKN